MDLSDDITLGEARELVWAAKRKGCKCPLCGRNVRDWKRTIHSGIARSMIDIYRLHGQDWCQITREISARSRDEGKLQFWNLLEEMPSDKVDGTSSGWWRLTDKGVAFVLNEITVPKTAFVYNNVFIDWVDENDRWSIVDAVSKKFDYNELMQGR